MFPVELVSPIKPIVPFVPIICLDSRRSPPLLVRHLGRISHWCPLRRTLWSVLIPLRLDCCTQPSMSLDEMIQVICKTGYEVRSLTNLERG